MSVSESLWADDASGTAEDDGADDAEEDEDGDADDEEAEDDAKVRAVNRCEADAEA